MLTENTMVLAKIEATYGTDPTPTSTENFIACYNVAVNPNVTYNDILAQDGSLSSRGGTMGRRYLEVTFDHELAPKSADKLALTCDVLLKACGYAYSTDSVYGTYKPYTSYPTGLSSVTLYVYHEDILWKASGARGNAAFTLTAGEIAKAAFTFQGLFTPLADGTFPATWTDLGSTKPFTAINQALSWSSSYAPEVESLSFTLGNTLFARPTLDDANAYGTAGIDITNRMGEGSFNPYAVKTATIPFQTAMDAVTQTAIAYVLNNGVGICEISLPKCELMNITPGDRSGTRIFDIPFRLARTTGDDEISIKCKSAT